MITTLIILNLLAKFGIIKRTSIFHPEQFLVISKKAFSRIKRLVISKERNTGVILIEIQNQ